MQHITAEHELDAIHHNYGALRELTAFYCFSSRIRIEANAIEMKIGEEEYRNVAVIQVSRNPTNEHGHDAIYDKNEEFVEAFVCDSLEEYKTEILKLIARYEQAPNIDA
jgi:hypothetical protein